MALEEGLDSSVSLLVRLAIDLNDWILMDSKFTRLIT